MVIDKLQNIISVTTGTDGYVMTARGDGQDVLITALPQNVDFLADTRSPFAPDRND